jgi:hypothetical protein
MLWRIWGTYKKGNGDKVKKCNGDKAPRVEHSVGCHLLGPTVRPHDGSRCVLVFFDDWTCACTAAGKLGAGSRQIQIPFPWLRREDLLFSFVADMECGSGRSWPRRTCGVPGAVATNSLWRQYRSSCVIIASSSEKSSDKVPFKSSHNLI